MTLIKLKDGDKVTIRENGNVNGYTFKGVTATSEEPPFVLEEGTHYTQTQESIEITIPYTTSTNLGKITFINERKAVAPTGLESDHTAPFALMVGAAFLAGAALLGNVVLRRRRRWQE